MNAQGTFNFKATAPCLACSTVPAPNCRYCDRCWARLPEATQQALPGILRRYLSHRPYAGQEQDREFIAQVRCRVLAELQGALNAADWATANTLTQRCTAFRSLQELLQAEGDYRPKLDCSARWCDDPEQLRANQQLADYYDRAQAARGDVRRCVRLGICGL